MKRELVPSGVLSTAHRREINGQKSLPTWKLHSRKETKTIQINRIYSMLDQDINMGILHGLIRVVGVYSG